MSRNRPNPTHSGSAHHRWLRSRTLSRLSIQLVVLAGLLFASTITLNLSLETPAFAAEDVCDKGTGVTVVVDFTELGGVIETGCATGDPTTGRAALLAAGFTAIDSQPGLLCAINAQPDPCPATFEGSFWSYWHSEPDDEWVSYQVGADSSNPAPGELEGWRYNDGTVGPGIDPATVMSALQPTPSTTPADTAPTFQAPTAEADATGSALIFVTLGFAAVLITAVLLFLLRFREGKTSGQLGNTNDND